MNRAAELAEADLGALRHHGNILHPQRRAALGHNHGVFDIGHVPDEPDFANVDLLQARLNEAAAGVDIVVGKLLLHLGKAQSVINQLVGIDANLILARRAAKAGNVHDVGNGLEVFFHHPVFNRFQVHDVVLRIGAVQGEEVDLADRAPVGAHLG